MQKLKSTRANFASGAIRNKDSDHPLHVAVVHSVNGVRLVTAATSRVALAERLADYVRQHAGNQLWPRDARRLRRLLAAGRLDAAIETYFGSVGERWDEERLVIETVEVGQSPGVTLDGFLQLAER